MYARVIVGTDGSARARRAEPVAATAAEAFGCDVDLVHVPADEDATDLDTSEMRVVGASDPASGLVEHARATDPPGLLCLSTRGRSAIGEVVFGSVTSKVIRSLHAPLLTVGPACDEPSAPWRRLLVCLDGSTTSASILPVAAAWARHLGLEVDLLHVAYPLGDPHSGDFEVPEETRTAAEQLRAAAEELQGSDVAADWSVEEHPVVATAIVERASRGLVDLVALATHGRTGLARVVAGSVASDVVRRCSVPVLTLRPEQLR